jgi:hypothetical protein
MKSSVSKRKKDRLVKEVISQGIAQTKKERKKQEAVPQVKKM